MSNLHTFRRYSTSLDFKRRQSKLKQKQAQKTRQKIQAQAEEIAKLSATVNDLKDEIDRLKKTPKRPKFRANNLESRNRSGKGKNDHLSNKSNTERLIPPKACKEIRVEAANVPEGSRFKGYQDFSLQEVEVIASDVTYKLEVWQAPDGKVIRAILPEEIQGQHFGPALRALMINLYSNGMTQPALLDFLYGLGVSISTGQISHILLNEAEALAKVSEEILTSGLQEAPYIRVDDTGEKHLHKNSYCTHIGGEHFAYYKTSSSKSRMNFLKLLLQGKDEGFYINDAMIWHLFQCGVEDDILNCFEKYKGKRYSSRRGLSRRLNTEGFSGKKLRGQCIEAGLVGFSLRQFCVQDKCFYLTEPDNLPFLIMRPVGFTWNDHCVKLAPKVNKLRMKSKRFEERYGPFIELSRKKRSIKRK